MERDNTLMSVSRQDEDFNQPRGSLVNHRPSSIERTHAILTAVEHTYPLAWQQAITMRHSRGATRPPPWSKGCYLPILCAHFIVTSTRDLPPSPRLHHSSVVAALAAWRITQGIYRFDGGMYDTLIRSEVDMGKSLVYGLPDWCVYIETPGLKWQGRAMHGFWVHRDSTIGGRHCTLRLLIDAAADVTDPFAINGGCNPVPIVLGSGTLEERLRCTFASGMTEERTGLYAVIGRQPLRNRVREIAPLVALVRCLGSKDSEIVTCDGAERSSLRLHQRPHIAAPIAAFQPTIWNVGLRKGRVPSAGR